ncbi:MAG: SoxR reducing system RseC family protein [Deltaproteobacteria bacterium]|nr:SoxR reducing system RseC family protein [Deltaproteobacteria bacterium]
MGQQVTKTGVVKAIQGSMAVAMTTREEACKHCKARGSCEMLGGSGIDVEVRALNTVGAQVGDIVTISMKSSSVLKASFFIYMVPILALIIGMVAGFVLAKVVPLKEELSVGIMAALGVAISFVWLNRKAESLSQQREFIPEIISKRRPAQPLSDVPPQCSLG